MIRKSDRRVVIDPTGRNSFSCNTLSNLACKSRGSSPISSNSAVPPLALSISPILAVAAPGERALDVAEQLAFHQRADHRRAIDGDERSRADLYYG